MSSNSGTFSPPTVSHDERPTIFATNENIPLLTLPAPVEMNHPKTRRWASIYTVAHFLYNKLCAFLNYVPMINIFWLGVTYGFYMAIIAHLWPSNPTIALVSTILNAVVILASLLAPPSHWFKAGYDSHRQVLIYIYLIVFVTMPCAHLIFHPVSSPDGSPSETENFWTPLGEGACRAVLLIFMVFLSTTAITFAMVFPGHGLYPYDEFRWRSSYSIPSSRRVSTFSIFWKACIQSINRRLIVWPRRRSRLPVDAKDEEMGGEANEKLNDIATHSEDIDK